MNPTRKEVDFPTHRVVFIIVSFLLGLLDMTLLYRALHALTGLNNGVSMIVAFIIATAANFIALTWGWGNGRRLEQKSINKRSLGEFLAWLAIGIMYAVIRTVNIIQHYGEDDFNWMGEVIQIVILAISYIGTGTLISASAREIWDNDAHQCRKIKKKFDEAHEDIAKSAADIEETIGVLSKYDLNYMTLENQYRKIYSALYRAEQSTMSSIVGRTVQEHPEITPEKAHAVMDEVIERRKKEGEEILQNQKA